MSSSNELPASSPLSSIERPDWDISTSTVDVNAWLSALASQTTDLTVWPTMICYTSEGTKTGFVQSSIALNAYD